MSLRLYAAGGGIVLLLLVGFLLVGRRARASAVENLGPADLFVAVDPGAKDLLLEDWRWKVGADAKVFRATVFGDLFTQDPQGKIYWLDTGSGRYVEVARSVEEWAASGEAHMREWFHWSTLRDLRSRGVKLKEGQVYSWRQDPMLGGAESVDNIDFIPLSVHVSHAGRVAEKIKDLPPGAKIDKFDFEVLGPPGAKTAEGQEIYEVVINEELEYSMWPAGQPLPPGWKSAGKRGTKQECLDYIAKVWTDMRPLSLRKKQGG